MRLFQELKESLEQQTATSEILGVIASSPTDIQPVLNTVAESAANYATRTMLLFVSLREMYFGGSPTMERFRLLYCRK